MDVKYGAAVLSMIMLCNVGCSNETGQANRTAKVAPKPVEVVDAASAACLDSFYNPLPDPSIRFDFSFHLKSDRIYQSGSDASVTRRGIVLEYLDGGADEIWMSIDKALTDNGYSPAGPVNNDGSGKLQQAYSKSGAPNLVVAVSGNPDMLIDPANPGAKGIIWISWQLPHSNGN